MKYIIIILILLSSCEGIGNKQNIGKTLFKVRSIDSCEYILLYARDTHDDDSLIANFIIHKHNCKYCQQRSKGDTIK